MQTVKIFVAGSKDLVEERNLFKIVANNIQVEFSDHLNVPNIQVYSFETFSYEFVDNGQQTSYNQFIQNKADLVFFIFDGNTGSKTMEEFDIAYYSYIKNQHPKIFVFSRLNGKEENENTKQLKARISLIGQYYTDYTSLDDLELKIEHSLRDILKKSTQRNKIISFVSRYKSRLLYSLLGILLLVGGAYFLPTLFSHENRLVEVDAIPLTKPICKMVNGVEFTMIKVSAGKFTMGGFDHDATAHEVIITNDFLLGQSEVTQSLWNSVMLDNPSTHKGEDLPVENVSWKECLAFIKKLNKLTGEKYRLPTEAEWEYAAKGGMARADSVKHLYSGGNNPDQVGWTINNSDQHTHPVMSKSPNAIGLYDMSGNVWEWCQDRYADYDLVNTIDPKGGRKGTVRVRRGGSYRDNSKCSLVSFRSKNSEDARYAWVGFRLALQINK